MASTRQVGIVSSIVLFAMLLGLVALPVAPAGAQTATLTVQPETAPQNSSITLSLSGFRSEETVTLWQTFPDFSVVGLGEVDVDENGSATLSLFVSSANPVGTHSFSARGNTSRRLATATFDLTLGEGSPSSDGIQILVRSEVAPQGNSFAFTGSGYAPDEDVSLWINLPPAAGNAVVDQGRVRTDRAGVFQATLELSSSYPEGRYQLTAYGNESGLTGIVTFELMRGGADLPRETDPTVRVSPARARQFEIVSIEGEHFGSDEKVSLWITLNDGRVVQVREIDTENDGFFAFDLDLRQFPVGRHELTAYGKTSTLRAVTSFEVLPGIGPESN